jgi:hypothetical protein
LSRARAKGYQIDWEQLMRSPLSEGFEQTVVVNRTGVYLRLQLPLLASLHVADWERVVHWMSQGGRRRDNVLLIEHADRLEARYRSL